MVRFRPTDLGRRLALLTAVVFTVLTLVASGPHRHVFTGRYGADSSAGSVTAGSIDHPIWGHAAPGSDDDSADCPLCDWQTIPCVLALTVLFVTALTATRTTIQTVSGSAARCSRPLPSPRLRGPPMPTSFGGVRFT